MRNPSRRAALLAAAAIAGAAAAGLGAARFTPGNGDWLPALLIVAGGLVAFACGLRLIEALLYRRGMAKLQAGIGLLARWQVSAADWELYRSADAERARTDPQALANDLTIRPQTPPEGVEVIVGESSLIVDGSYHPLRPNGLPELRSIGWLDNSAAPGRPPDCLEFVLAYPRNKYGGVVRVGLRVPVPQAALGQGRRVWSHFAPVLERRQARRPIALRNPRRTLQACGAILVLGLALAGWGWLEAERSGWHTAEAQTPLILLGAGTMGVVFAVVLGGLTLLLRPR